MAQIEDLLLPGDFFKPCCSCAVSVVEHRHYADEHIDTGPPSIQVASGVLSLHKPALVRVTGVKLFGAFKGANGLGLELYAPRIVADHNTFSRHIQDISGVGLNDEIPLSPHSTIARIRRAHLAYYQEILPEFSSRIAGGILKFMAPGLVRELQ